MQAGSDFEQGGYRRQALKEGKAASHQMIRDSISSTGNSRCRGPKARVCLTCSRNSRSGVCEGETRREGDQRGRGRILEANRPLPALERGGY